MSNDSDGVNPDPDGVESGRWAPDTHDDVTEDKLEAYEDRRRREKAREKTPSRVPPHNLDAERSLLGALLLSRKALDDAARAYADAHTALATQHARAMAASQAYTEARQAARNAPDWQRHKAHLDADTAKDAMGKAWKRADTAMHAEWAARDALCAAAVAACAAPTLFDADADADEQAA